MIWTEGSCLRSSRLSLLVSRATCETVVSLGRCFGVLIISKSTISTWAVGGSLAATVSVFLFSLMRRYSIGHHRVRLGPLGS
jgi:hypothetical protein